MDATYTPEEILQVFAIMSDTRVAMAGKRVF